MDDEGVVEQIVGGNRQAFRLLVLRYERPLFRFLALLGFDAASREDLAQQTFLSAFRALTAFDATKGRFSTWLFTIAKNHAAHERQRAHRRHEISPTETVEGSLRGAESDPVESLVLAQRTRALEEALRALPAVLQSTFILSQVKDLTLEEVAAVEGCPVGTVKSRIHRAREYLRSALIRKETA